MASMATYIPGQEEKEPALEEESSSEEESISSDEESSEDAEGAKSTDRAGGRPNKKPNKRPNNNGGRRPNGSTADKSLKREFDLLDLDNSGFIDKNDMKKVFGKYCPESLVTKAIAMFDTNKDGKISFTEFKAIRKTMGMIKLPKSFGKK